MAAGKHLWMRLWRMMVARTTVRTIINKEKQGKKKPTELTSPLFFFAVIDGPEQCGKRNGNKKKKTE
jgi:hypothetical protein